jgi:hypothetical protein
MDSLEPMMRLKEYFLRHYRKSLKRRKQLLLMGRVMTYQRRMQLKKRRKKMLKNTNRSSKSIFTLTL